MNLLMINKNGEREMDRIKFPDNEVTSNRMN